MRSLHPWPIFPLNLDPPVTRSLSIQFLLQTLMDGFQHLKNIQTATPLQLQGANFKEEISCICKELEVFLLFAMDNPFAQKSSILDKLYFYSEILLQASHVRDNQFLLILDEMRNDVLNMNIQLNAWKKTPIPIGEIFDALFQLYEILDQKFRRYFASFAPFLKEARSDENVLIYLIENKDKLNAFLGDRHIEDLLQTFFPAGHDQLRAAIYEGFTRRGFTTFLSSVEPLIDAIEWETPCHSPAKA